MAITALLPLPLLSPSIAYRVYLELINSISLIEWWRTSVQSMGGVQKVVILCRSKEERPPYRQCSDIKGAASQIQRPAASLTLGLLGANCFQRVDLRGAARGRKCGKGSDCGQ